MFKRLKIFVCFISTTGAQTPGSMYNHLNMIGAENFLNLIVDLIDGYYKINK